MQLPDQKDWPILKEMMEERDRGAALIGAGFLESKLEDAIKTCLRPDEKTFTRIFKPGGPLGNFGSKALLAYMLGLMRKETRDDFKIIGDIRNKFAHVPEPIDFETKEIRDWCAELSLFERVWGSIPEPEHRPMKPATPRAQYLATISLAANWLHHQAAHPGQFRNRDDLPF